MAVDLELTTLEVDRTLKTLVHSADLAANDHLKVTVGGDKLNAQVPAGKKWAVSVNIYVSEMDA